MSESIHPHSREIDLVIEAVRNDRVQIRQISHYLCKNHELHVADRDLSGLLQSAKRQGSLVYDGYWRLTEQAKLEAKQACLPLGQLQGG